MKEQEVVAAIIRCLVFLAISYGLYKQEYYWASALFLIIACTKPDKDFIK